jgi:hypothetical protein
VNVLVTGAVTPVISLTIVYLEPAAGLTAGENAATFANGISVVANNDPAAKIDNLLCFILFDLSFMTFLVFYS